MTHRLLDPKIDFIFKTIFGTQNHSNILIALLNEILYGYEAENRIEVTTKITQITIINPILAGHSMEEKTSILDIRATTSTGEEINVEMQIKNEYNTQNRSIYYGSKLLSSQLVVNENYQDLRPTIVIFILNFIAFGQESNVHNTYKLQNIHSNVALSNLLTFHYIELPKVLAKNANKYRYNITDNLFAWLIFLINPHDERCYMTTRTMKELDEAVDLLAKLSADRDVQMLYDARLKASLDYNSAMRHAKESGLAVGTKKGIKAGTKLGKALGIEEGRQEGLQQIIATLQAKNYNNAQIAEMLEIDINTIKNPSI
jgi:predicted transposase/invertase (TIGR01784 family)